MIPRNAVKAFRNLLEWAERPARSGLKARVYKEHLEPVADGFGVGEHEIPDLLGPPVWEILDAFIEEDFLAGRFGEDEDVNVTGDYLKEHGRRETAAGRGYLEAFRDSSASLYEVADIDPGRSLKLRDLIGDEDDLAVQDRICSERLVIWDRMAARVVRVNGRHRLTGVILPFSQAMSRELLGDMEAAVRKASREFRRELRKKKGSSPVVPHISRRLALECLPRTRMLTGYWMVQMMMREGSGVAEFRSPNDEPARFCEVRFPLRGSMAKVAGVLDGIPALEPSDEQGGTGDAGGGGTWDWFGPEDSGQRSRKRRKSISLMDRLAPGSGKKTGVTWLGEVVLGKEELILTVNSIELGHRGREMLSFRLGDLVGEPEVSGGETEERPQVPDRAGLLERGEAPVASAEMQEIHSKLDSQYRLALDEPMPMLGGRTPRQAAAVRGKSRRAVIDWIKEVENGEHGIARERGVTPYDTGWIWLELGIPRPG